MTEINELAQRMLDLDEEILKAQLGIQAQKIAQDTTARSASLDSLNDAITVISRGVLDEADINFGDRLFKRLNVKSYNLMCGELFNEQEIQTKFQTAFKDSLEKVTEVLTPILIANLGLASPIATITAVLIVKTIVSTTKTISSATSETICEIWKESLADEDEILDSDRLPENTSTSEQSGSLAVSPLEP